MELRIYIYIECRCVVYKQFCLLSAHLPKMYLHIELYLSCTLTGVLDLLAQEPKEKPDTVRRVSAHKTTIKINGKNLQTLHIAEQQPEHTRTYL